MNRKRRAGEMAGARLAIVLGLVAGIALVIVSRFDADRVDRSGRLEIGVNGVEHRMSRDILVPNSGWTLQLRHPGITADAIREGLELELRSERTGAILPIADRLVYGDDRSTLLVPESLGIGEGLLSVRARWTNPEGVRFEDRRRIRIRRWFGGRPIGARQVVRFDFGIDHDGDGRADFVQDLDRLGFTTPERPAFARAFAARIEETALQRVERAYDDPTDPNQTGRPRDAVTVYFRETDDPAAIVTRICVGGANPTVEASIGYVRFDRRNEEKFSDECGGEPFAGIFPAEFAIYRDAPLYREILDPFDPDHGGTPLGDDPADRLDAIETPPDTAPKPGSRAAAIERAIEVFGHALGSVMAHEAGHALGLVASGKPGVGLFGGDEGETYVHNLDTFGEPETEPWLMNVGPRLRFDELAGAGPTGPLRFRPLNYAYLRDRVVLDDRR